MAADLPAALPTVLPAPVPAMLADRMMRWAGIGLRYCHYEDWLTHPDEIGFVEVHSENYFGGGYHLEVLSELAQHYPVSLHGVGLSLGSSEPVDATHVARLAQLERRIRPALISDHLSWSRSGNAHLGDLLPLCYHEEVLDCVCDNIKRVQDALGRPLLVENPSTYLQPADSTMSEAEFVRRVIERTSCRLLLDVNNLFVQQHNHGLDAMAYLMHFERGQIGEIHLAGPIEYRTASGRLMMIDTHSTPVRDEVWALYEAALMRFGATPTLIEWDKDIPAFSIVQQQAACASAILAQHPSASEVQHAVV